MINAASGVVTSGAGAASFGFINSSCAVNVISVLNICEKIAATKGSSSSGTQLAIAQDIAVTSETSSQGFIVSHLYEVYE